MQVAAIVSLFIMLSSTPNPAQTNDKKARGDVPKPDVAAPLRFTINPRSPPYFANIDSVNQEGTVQISSNMMAQIPAELRPEIVEGYYMGVVQKAFGTSLAGARLVRVQVTDVGANSVVRLQIAKPAASELKAGEFIMLFRPVRATTAQLKQLPDLAPLEEGPAPGATKEDREILKLNQSFDNLKKIGLALHGFHETFNHFPPASVTGPDEKPWHSWRVLILPWLDHADIYNAYKLDEPWNGSNNKRLLEKMPAVFADPIYGENKDFYTHYVAITGARMAFTAEGAKYDGNANDLSSVYSPGTEGQSITDGSSNSLQVGPVGPERKIQWMKPEDILVDDNFPQLGKKGSFVLPYKTEKGSAAPFLRCDGSVAAILESIDNETFRSLLTIKGGEMIGDYPTITPSGARGPVVYIIKEGKKTIARLSMEVLEPAPPPGGTSEEVPLPSLNLLK